MKIKSVIFTILIMILILLMSGSDVKASDFKTWFYEENKGDWYVGRSMDFTQSEWYKSYNIFCMTAGAKTPTNLLAENRMDTTDGKNFIWHNESGKYSDEKTAKFLYVISTLYDDIAKETVAARTKNWEAVQQHAIWSIIGQSASNSAGITYKQQHQAEINQMLANANAYYEFWRNNGENYQNSLDVSNIKYENGILGPFKVDYKEYEATYENAKGKYGEITDITLVYVDESGNVTRSCQCYDSSHGVKGMLSDFPKANTDLYINGIGDIENYNAIRITFNNQYAKDGYLILGHSKNYGQQSSMFGHILRYETMVQEKFELLEDEFTFKIVKTDKETGERIPGVKFLTGYGDDALKEHITDANGEANVTIFVGDDKEEVVINVHETAPNGYKALGYGLQLTFKKENDQWQCIKIARLIYSEQNLETIYENGKNVFADELITFVPNNPLTNDMVGILSVKNEKEDPEVIELNIYKVDADNLTKQLDGAEFSISVENGKPDSDTITVNGSTTIKIKPEDKTKTVEITIKETEAPEGYELNEATIKITYTYKEDSNGNGDWKLTNKSGGHAAITGNILRIENEPIDPDPDPDDDPDPDLDPDPDSDPNPDTDPDTDPDPDPTPDTVTGEDILEGYVYLDGYSGNKIVSEPNGRKDSGEQGIKGVIVKLSDGRETVTDTNGYYKFDNIVRGRTYTITFEYDGVNYEATITGGDSEATETGRSNFNNKFKTINYAKTAEGIGLNYWAFGDTSNWNPIYNEKPGWLLKTLNQEHIVSNGDFKISAKATLAVEADDPDNPSPEAKTYTVNYGLVKREVDLSAVNDLKEVKVSINGKATTYHYEDIPIMGDTINIGNVSSDTQKSYLLELDEKDFLYGTAGTNYSGVVELEQYSQNNNLKVEATYKIVLNNQSNTKATINSIVYYYDTEYKLNGVSKGTASGETQVTIDGKTYNKVDITNLNIPVEAGAQGTLEVYLEINARGDQIKKETYKTIAEITSYSTDEGKVDIDSAPGNSVQTDNLVYEDDTDTAPGLTITAEGTRVLSGYVWDDSKKDAGAYTFADGIKESAEPAIKDVIVQLIEIKEIDNLKHYYLWQEVTTNENGTYEFINFIPGNYIVKFIYGATEQTKAYNGQDYKSTTDVNYVKYKDGKWYNEYHDLASDTSVARDDEARRLEVIVNTAEIDTNIGTALRDKTNTTIPSVGEWRYTDNTYMYADTSKINIAVASETGKEIEDSNTVDGKVGNYYNFKAVNFGVEERPKTAIDLERHVTGMRVTASDGTTILDAEFLKNENGRVILTPNSIITGLQAFYATETNRNKWYLATDIEEVIAGATLEIIYTYTVTNVGEIDYISNTLAEAFENKTIEEYKTLLNEKANEIREDIKQKDYNSKLGNCLGTVYYSPIVNADGSIGNTDVRVVKTHVGKIEDYINNDLKFSEVTSSDFEINTVESGKEYKLYKPQQETGAWSEAKETIKTVVISKNDVGNISPEDNAKTQTITLESNGKLTSTGTLDFPGYIAQIKTAYSNPMGRRDVDSIPGNLEYIDNDALESNEPDEFWVETVAITKPTGEDRQTAVTLAASISAGIVVLVAGISTIKKYLL